MPFNFSSPEFLSHRKTRNNRVTPVSRASLAHINSPLKSSSVSGNFKQTSFRAFQIAAHTSLIIRHTVLQPILKLKDWDCCESPVVRNLKVSTSFPFMEIGSLLRHLHVFIYRPIRFKRCSNLSGDICINLVIQSIAIVVNNFAVDM